MRSQLHASVVLPRKNSSCYLFIERMDTYISGPKEKEKSSKVITGN